jgi:hypothetical protein
MPVWAGEMRVYRGDTLILNEPGLPETSGSTSGGYDPRGAKFVPLPGAANGEELRVEFDLPVRLRRAGARVKGHAGKAAVTRGPLVFCLEDTDNPGIDIFHARVDTSSLEPVYDAGLLGGTVKLAGRTADGQPLVMIPYFLWGNRGPSRMTVWVNV